MPGVSRRGPVLYNDIMKENNTPTPPRVEFPYKGSTRVVENYVFKPTQAGDTCLVGFEVATASVKSFRVDRILEEGPIRSLVTA